MRPHVLGQFDETEGDMSGGEWSMPNLNADNHTVAVQIAQVPDSIRGYGHVKERNVTAARSRWQQLLQSFDAA